MQISGRIGASPNKNGAVARAVRISEDIARGQLSVAARKRILRLVLRLCVSNRETPTHAQHQVVRAEIL
jgi:hypothetical protein